MSDEMMNPKPSTESVTIVLGWPPKELTAQQGRNPQARKRATRAYRKSAHALSIQQVPKRESWARSVVTYAFYMPDARLRDSANMVQMAKAGIDGIVDAGVIAGDDWRRLRSGGEKVDIDRDNPRVEITLTKEQL